MKFGGGYIPDPQGHRRTPFARHYAASLVSVPTFVDLRKCAPPVKDQGQTGSCTGHGTSGAISTTLRAKGAPLPFEPSECGIYTVARAVDRTLNAAGVLPPLTDDGAMPNQVMRGIEEWGVRPSRSPAPDGRNSDADPATINDEPTLAEIEQDATRILVGDYAIGLFDRVALTKKALAAGVAVGIGFDVDNAFEGYASGDAPLSAPGTALGGHWVYLVGYSTSASGKAIFIGRNSWAQSWGFAGDFEATEEWLICAFDVIALDVRNP